MDFRSERGQTQNTAIINYIPNFTKIHTYRLLSLYPYASQVLGEIGGQAEVSKYLNSGSSFTLNLAAYDQPKIYLWIIAMIKTVPRSRCRV